MKRILALLLAMIMILSLCACGNNTADNTDGGTTANTESSTTGTEDTTGNTEKPDETTSSTEGTEESTTTTEDPQTTEGTEKPTEDTKPTEKPTEQTKPTEPTGGNKPTGNTTPTTTPPTTETKECQHTNAFNVPNDDTSHPVPTCTKDGYYLKYCPDCYKHWHEGATALGHSGGTASCKNRAKCTRCQQEYGELDTTKHANTSSRINNAKNPTCEEDGYEGDLRYCTDCKTTLEKGAVLKALGHNLCKRWINEYKFEVYCYRWNCDYSKYTDILPIDFTFSDLEYDSFGSVVANPKFKIHITGGYFELEGKYKFECYRSNGSNTLHYIESDGNILSVKYYGDFRLGETVTIQISDNTGHSKTKIFTYILDPTNEHNLILKEIN